MSPTSTRRRRPTAAFLTSLIAVLGLTISPAAAAETTVPIHSEVVAAEAASTHPTVFPVPQSLTWDDSQSLPLSGPVILDVANGDQPTADLLRGVVEAAGGSIVEAGTDGATTITVSTVPAEQQGDDVSQVPAHAEAYLLTTSTQPSPTIAIQGADDRGAYYGAQTLAQLVVDGTVTGARVRDWPLMSVRGTIEGFYGIPWSHQARQDILAWSGPHKMNTYIYTPKDDRYLRAAWRELYPAEELAELKELVDEAASHHVDFVFALSPGNDICYSKDSDYQATTAKFEQLRSIGVRSFYIALDDINPTLNCDEDWDTFPSRGPWTQLADAQSYYLNKVQNDYIKGHQLPDLMMVPTNYNGNATDPFKTAQGERLDQNIRMQWTGMGVFSDTISSAEVVKATQTYNNHHMFLWDNFPVNDGQRGRLFLNPLTGRDSELYKHLEGFTSNPMIEPYASFPSLANYGDYTWNGPAYDAKASFSAALGRIAGEDPAVRASLDAFVDLNQSWGPYRQDSEHAPALSADIEAFNAALAGQDEEALTAATTTLRDRLALIADTPSSLKNLAVTGFYDDVAPWAEAAADWAHASEEAVNLRLALRSGDGEAATAALLKMQQHEQVASTTKRVDDMNSSFEYTENAIVPSIGDGVFQDFLSSATRAWNEWLALPAAQGASSLDVADVTTTMGQYGDNAPSRAADGDDNTFWWSSSSPSAGSSLTVDLGEVKEVGNVVIEQGRAANQTGDMIYHAAVEVSSDGQQWERVGTYENSPTITQNLPAGTQARYVRLVATAASSNWVQVREFTVSAPLTGLSTTLTTADGHGVTAAADADGGTWLQAASPEAAEGSVTREYPQALTGVLSAVVAGSLTGTVEVLDAQGTWKAVGELSADRAYQVFPFEGPATGVRVSGTGASPLPRILELGLRPLRAGDVDKSGLEASIKAAEEAKETVAYTKASEKAKADLDAALATAKEVDAKVEATPQEVAAAKEALDAAVKALDGQETPSEPTDQPTEPSEPTDAPSQPTGTPSQPTGTPTSPSGKDTARDKTRQRLAKTGVSIGLGLAAAAGLAGAGTLLARRRHDV